jgi:hypothetical protein
MADAFDCPDRGTYTGTSYTDKLPRISKSELRLHMRDAFLTNPPWLQWLVSKNRIAEASSILSKYHANGILDDPLVQWELVEIGMVLEREGVGHHASYRDFFMTAGNRRRLVVLLSLCIGSNWVGNGIIS